MSLTSMSINYLRQWYQVNDKTLLLIEKVVSDPKFLEAQELKHIQDDEPNPALNENKKKK